MTRRRYNVGAPAFWTGVVICWFLGWILAVWFHDHVSKTWLGGGNDPIALILWVLVASALTWVWDAWCGRV